jgi:hypothetical protein
MLNRFAAIADGEWMAVCPAVGDRQIMVCPSREYVWDP